VTGTNLNDEGDIVHALPWQHNLNKSDSGNPGAVQWHFATIIHSK
jgi:hypothetical protein